MATQTLVNDTAAGAVGDSDTQKSRYRAVLDVGVLLATIIFFLLFMLLLIRVVFPQGARLSDIAPETGSGLDTERRGGGLSLASEHAGATAFVARLGDVHRRVQIRAADSVVWSSASVGRAVRNHDAVQTFANSRARVDFTTDNELRIDQNSLVVFRSGEADPFLQRREPAVVVLEGELNGRVNAEYGSLLVEAPSGIVMLTADRETGDPAAFKLSVNPDKSSTIAIYAGTGEIDIRGRRHRIMANQALTVTEDGSTDGVRALPALPVVRGPQNGSVAWFRDLPPRVKFRWGGVDNAQRYRLEVAADRNFEDILVDEHITSTAFVHGNLAAGNYYWRISARNGWMQGPVSQPRRLRVARDAEPPLLEIDAIGSMAAGGYAVRGKTSPDAQVFVGGKPVQITSAGVFEHAFDALPGTQPIMIEAIDAVGNVAYQSRILHAGQPFRRND